MHQGKSGAFDHMDPSRMLQIPPDIHERGGTYPDHGLLAQPALGDLVAVHLLQVGLHLGDEAGSEPNPLPVPL